MIDWGVTLTLQASSQAAIEMMRTNFLTDQREELKKIDIPVLILHGDADQTSPFEITGKRTEELLSQSHLKIYESKAHGIIITEADRICEDVFNFISSY